VALLQKGVNQRRLPVVDVSDDRHIANVMSEICERHMAVLITGVGDADKVPAVGLYGPGREPRPFQLVQHWAGCSPKMTPGDAAGEVTSGPE
jgi:hypothetical protein